MIDGSNLAGRGSVNGHTQQQDYGFLPAADLVDHNWLSPAEGQTRPVWVATWLPGEGRSGWVSMEAAAESGVGLLGGVKSGGETLTEAG